MSKEKMKNNCPTCNSPAPHLHPAMQHEGEVTICTDDFHLKQTPQNNAAMILDVLQEQERKADLQKEAREPRKRTAIQQEIVDLIRFYEKRGSDWTVPAEFTLVRHSRNLEKIIRPRNPSQ